MSGPLALCNSLVILATCVVSFLAFTNRIPEDKFIFQPQSILADKEYYRLVTSGFLHGGWSHLLWNMISLYFFGGLVELFFGRADFLLIYFGSIVGGSLLSLYVHRHHDYLAYGASGGVCGIIFAHILLLPGSGVCLYFIPVSIPGWLYAVVFLIGSFVAMKQGKDNIGHDAHLGGAIIGLLIAAGLHPQAVQYNWKVFLIVLAAALALLVYLWLNPLFLPVSALVGSSLKRKREKGAQPQYTNEAAEVDAILEKVAVGGMESLTSKEKCRLEEVSAKYQRRATSKKPESDLSI